MNLAHLSDEEVVTKLDEHCADNRRSLVAILRYLIEVEDRRIHLKMACSSMFDFCVRHRRMSEGEAYRRIAVARLARRFPSLLERIATGELCLTKLATISRYVTHENVSELVDATVDRTCLQVQMFIAERFGRAGPSIRYGLPFIPDRELMDMMERARQLFSHAVPNGDLLALTKRAFALLIEEGEKRMRGKVAKPAAATGRPTKGISAAATRAIYERDGGQCTYVDPATGARCPARCFVQRDHVRARALGGGHDVDNLRLACAAHNHWFAELAFGREYVEKRVHLRQRKSARASGTNDPPP